MQNIIIDNITLIMLFPLWIFLTIMCGRFFSVYVNKGIIYILTLLSSLCGALLCIFTLVRYTKPLDLIYPFIKINNFIIEFGVRIDKLSLIMGLVLFIVSFCVQLFSVPYMKEEKKNYRFFALLNLFNFSMAALLFSPNLFQMYVFWELVGVISYILIGFDYTKEDKSIASKRVFLINRIGDTALIFGILLTSYYMYNYAGNLSFTTLSFEDFTGISTLLSAYVSPTFFIIICSLFIIGASVKSAQIPFYTWLQDAMRAKLPVSALLHSATMVALGVYLIARLMPFFALNEITLKSIFYIGLITAVICSILACIEVKPKKILAYSTSANLGLMFTALGICNIKIAILLFISHALIKSALFLSLSKFKNKISIFFVLGALSLTFLMPAKEILYANFEYKNLFLLLVFLSVVYIFRLWFIISSGKEKQLRFSLEHCSVAILLLLNSLGIFILYKEFSLKIIFVSILGILSVIVLNKFNILTKFRRTPKILECFNNYIIPLMYNYIARFMSFIEINLFSNHKPILFLSKTSVNLFGWIEKNVMNKCVSILVQFSKNTSTAFMKLQSGNVQTYNAYAFIIFTVIISFLIAGYLIILDKIVS